MSHLKKSQIADAKLSGVLERIIFLNEENQYCVGEIRESGERDSIVISGVLPGVQCGETLELEGDWVIHPRHGDQFKIRAYTSKLPSSVYGIRKYLGSGLVPGIGKVYANKIVDHFGTETLRVISEESVRLRDVPGIGAHRAKAIKEAWESQRSVRDVMMFLQTYGVSVAQCLRLVKKYGSAAKLIIQRQPYTIAREIDGIGFKTADRIAINIGFANDSPQRIEAGILYALQTLEDNGHTGYPLPEFQSFASELMEADSNLIAKHLDILINAGSIRIPSGGDILQLPATEEAERKVAHSVSQILSHASRQPPIKIEAAIEWAQKRAGFGFGPDQVNAIRSALTEKISIITGGPGTGKTTILRAVLEILRAKRVKVLMASPTGRAAQRMTEATGGFAQTIHRLLKYDPFQGQFTVNEDSPLKVDTLIVDEASMLDNRLASVLLRAIPAAAHLILVGDVDQLPSVGAGNVLRDLISSVRVKVTRLEKIFRQEEQSSIVRVAHEILHGNPSPPYPKNSLTGEDAKYDFQFLKTTSPEQCLDLIKSICRDFIPAYTDFNPVRDVEILAPIHKGIAGITNLNRELQATLNTSKRGLSVGSSSYRVGDKIIQTRNNYEKNIFNGDLGIVSSINPESSSLAAEFDGEIIEFDRLDIADLKLAYAISVHKSQGSEFPVVVLPLLKQHYMMLQRNLLYTAISRGKKKVFIVGDPTAYAMAVRNKKSVARHTDLKRKIQALLPPDRSGLS